MTDFGFYIKKSERDFDVKVDPEVKYSGYNVVDKTIDPFNKYDVDEVIEYAIENPDMELPVWPLEVKTFEERCEEVRELRNQKIASVRWRIERNQDEVLMGIPVTEPLLPILLYIQDLRNLTEQEGFPDTVVWPLEP